MLALGAGVHKGLGNNRQRGIHHLRHVHVKGEVRVLQDVHPKPKWEAAGVGVEDMAEEIKNFLNATVTQLSTEIWEICKSDFKFCWRN